VCGITLPISEIGALCRRYGIKFIVDGAQSAGTHPIDMKKCNIDALCCPGHKGLYGPQGTGFVIFSDRYSDEKSIRTLSPFVSGGNGMNSEERYMPDILPERFEAGTLNTPGIAGLSEGVSFVSSLSVEHIFDRICKLYNRAKELLFDIDGVKIYCGELNESSCLLFNIEGMPSDTVADLLNDDGICVRGGLHCAPLVHKKLKTTNGAVRASFSYFNNMSDVEALYNSVKRIAKEKV
jgi:selenocysteine lyase/cysteine desulfurase